MPSARQDPSQTHEEIRRKYVNLAWSLWREQYKTNFFVWHPLPEEHLAIELTLYWQGQISQIHGFTDIPGQIVAPIRDAFNSILSWFWQNVIRPGVEAIVGAVKWVIDGIASTVNGIVNTLGSMWQSITEAFSSLANTIGSGLAQVGDWVKGGLEWVWKQMEGFFSQLAEVFKQIGMWLVNGIKTYVVDPILSLLQAAFEGIKGVITGIWNFITGGASPSQGPAWRGSYVRWLGIITGVLGLGLAGVVGLTLVDIIHPFKDTKAAETLKWLIGFSGMTFLQAAFFSTYFDVATAKPVRQELNSIFRPEVPSIGDATRMLWRGSISQQDFDDVIAVHGYGEPWASGYKALAEQLPGAGDLITFVVREVITPDKFIETMALQGFSKAWAEAYWEAHWMLPPPERVRTAFLRKQISEQEYRRFLVWQDFKPTPRPGIHLSDVDIMLETQYDLPGRIDTRWLLEWGKISPAEAARLIEAGGMHPEWAPKLAEVYLLNQLRDELNRLRTVLMEQRKEGFLSKAALESRLRKLSFASHVIQATLTWADEMATWESVKEQADEWWRLAKAGKISPETYANEVRKLGMDEERITKKMELLRRLAEIRQMEKRGEGK